MIHFYRRHRRKITIASLSLAMLAMLAGHTYIWVTYRFEHTGSPDLNLVPKTTQLKNSILRSGEGFPLAGFKEIPMPEGTRVFEDADKRKVWIYESQLNSSLFKYILDNAQSEDEFNSFIDVISMTPEQISFFNSIESMGQKRVSLEQKGILLSGRKKGGIKVWHRHPYQIIQLGVATPDTPSEKDVELHIFKEGTYNRDIIFTDSSKTGFNDEQINRVLLYFTSES